MVVESSVLQALSSPDTISPEFILPEPDRPSATFPNVPDIPIVDLGEPDPAKVVAAVAAAGREWGICYVVNHGIPEDVIKRLQTAGKEFFELPLEEKEWCAGDNNPPPAPESVSDEQQIYGYCIPLARKGPDVKKFWSDHLVHVVWPPSDSDSRYSQPRYPPSYRKCGEVNEEYTSYVRQVADRLFRALSLGLGLQENTLKVAAGGEDMDYSFRINFYPPCPRPDLALGLAPHTDFCAITFILPNEVPGLQVFKDDQWFDAKYVPNSLFFLIGDQMEVLSNGAYKSVLHRTTVNKEKVRMSWPMFIRPPQELVVGPLPEMVSHQNPAKFKAKKFKDYMFCKINKIPQ